MQSFGLVHFQQAGVHILGLDDTGQLFKGEHEVHIGADGAAGSFQLLCGAGSNEAHTGLGVLLLHHAGGEHHGGHGHGDVLARSGKAVFAIMLHAGQQEVAMKLSFSGTSSRKSCASSTVHRSAPMATSTTS